MDCSITGFMALGLNIPNKCFPFLRCGPLIDLCRGPHVRHTGKIKTIKIHKVSAGTVLYKCFHCNASDALLPLGLARNVL